MNSTSPRNRGLLLFDYDGVLADSLNTLSEYTTIFCREHGLGEGLKTTDVDAMESATLAGLIEAAGISQAYVRDYARYLFQALNRDPLKVPLFKGIPKMLTDLARHYTLCVVTANHSAIVRQRLDAAQLTSLMGCIYGNEQPGGKVDHIINALETNHAQPASTWMIGDTVGDIEAAQNAGVNAVAVTWGWQSSIRLKSKAPDLMFEKPQALHHYFKNTWQQTTAKAGIPR
ncbi:MAG: HAD family hydrolase [Gammaproteobacteria bacterium]|nr:HAD family hydrolase [Gammaproteobacteria bacterium]